MASRRKRRGQRAFVLAVGALLSAKRRMPNSDLRVFPRAHAAVSDLPFPVLEEPAADRWRWPMPPFAWHHQRPDDDAVGQACRLETADGLFLFTPVDEARSVQRMFVPRWAYHRAEFGASAEETAAQRWISDPQTLLQAIEQQNRKPVLPIGQALLDLGMLTREQLEQ